MKLLKTLDHRDYDPTWPESRREAARAVLQRGGRIALAYGAAEGFYKFPGGGVRPGEDAVQAMIRETLEETGLTVLPGTVRPLGAVIERQKSGDHACAIFVQRSVYYLAEAAEGVSRQNLDAYERLMGLSLVWATPEEAMRANLEAHRRTGASFLLREAFVLGYLAEHGFG